MTPDTTPTPLSESTAWAIYADALELVINAIVGGVLVALGVGLLIGLVVDPVAGSIAANVAGLVAVLSILVNKMKAVLRLAQR